MGQRLDWEACAVLNLFFGVFVISWFALSGLSGAPPTGRIG